jgi:predicted DCC family thiol-disulfide oxidoreductase YuxK
MSTAEIGQRRTSALTVVRLNWRGWYSAVTTRRFAARGSAALRIGFGSIWVLFLLREYSERDTAWGPDSPWSPTLDHAYATGSHWPGWIAAWFTSVSDLTRTEFDWYYLLTLAIGAAFALGWRTRAISILFMWSVLALENRAPLLTDGGDNVLTLMAVYLVFAASADHWSLDARRRGRVMMNRSDDTESRITPKWRRELAAVRRQSVTLMHNGAVLVIAAQVCVIYATAGLSKVQGSMWQNGSAMGYVLRLTWFQPWPGLSMWFASHALALTAVGYLTVLLQSGFTFVVFSPRLKYPTLVVLVLMHLSIAILLGLPFFSGIMLIGDGIFLSDRVWQAIGRWVAGPAYARSMTSSGGQDGRDSLGGLGGPDSDDQRATLVFDGDCAFCTSSINWAKRHLGAAVDYVPWQELDLESAGLTQAKVERAVQWLPAPTARGPIRSGAGAVGRLLLSSRWPWRALGPLALLPPFSWLAALCYRIISANRHRLPGGTPACALSVEQRAVEQRAVEQRAVEQRAVEQQATEQRATPSRSLPSALVLPEREGDVEGGPDHARTGPAGVELTEGDHAD